MSGQGNENLYSSGQPQARRDDAPSDQSPNFLQETGTQVKNMAQGAADIGKGAAHGATSVARGAALGAANIATGAADIVKNTVGSNPPQDSAAAGNANIPNYLDEYPKHNPSNPNI